MNELAINAADEVLLALTHESLDTLALVEWEIIESQVVGDDAWAVVEIDGRRFKVEVVAQ